MEDKMKKAVVLFLVLAGFVCLAVAEDVKPDISVAAPAASDESSAVKEEGWKKPVLTGGINLSQAGFNNWVAGGENSLAWQAVVDASADYVGTIKWSNKLKIRYGQITTDSAGTRKSDDEIRLDTMGEYNTGIPVNPFVSLMIQTQVMPGYDYSSGKIEISRFMDPGYIKESVGAALSLGDMLVVKGGAAIKHTIAPVYSLRYNGSEDADVKSELGAVLTADFNAKIMENLLFKSGAEMFTNFMGFESIDAKLDSTLTAKINEFVNVNFNIVLMYDRDLSKAMQLKESLSIGITYNFL